MHSPGDRRTADCAISAHHLLELHLRQLRTHLLRIGEGTWWLTLRWRPRTTWSMLGELGWRSMLWRHVHALLRWHIHAWLWTWCSVGRATHARMLGRTTRLVKECWVHVGCGCAVWSARTWCWGKATWRTLRRETTVHGWTTPVGTSRTLTGMPIGPPWNCKAEKTGLFTVPNDRIESVSKL